MILPKDVNYEIQIQESDGLSALSINIQDGIAGTEARILVVAFPGRKSCGGALKVSQWLR